MKNQVYAVLLGVGFGLASTSVSHAKSELISLSKEPVWPVSSTPDGSLVYNVTTVGRAGSGLLLVTLTAGALPPGVSVTFSPSVLRFTGNQATSQNATMTVTCTNLVPVDCFPFTLTGTSQRETITITNEVLCSLQAIAIRPASLMVDRLAEGMLRIRGLGATGKTYEIQSASTLTNPVWTLEGTSTADANGRFTFFPVAKASVPALFFRAVTTPGPFGQ